MPTNTRSSSTSLRSAISCAMRVKARWMAWALRMTLDSAIKKANQSPGLVRRYDVCLHRASLATSRGRLKGAIQSLKSILISCLPCLAPLGAVLDNPVRQRPLEADIMPGFFRLNPFVLKDLFAFGLKLAVERRILQHIPRRKVFFVVRHITNQNLFVRGT